MRIALTGNPNSGKTTMFNALTGRNDITVDGKKVEPVKALGACIAFYVEGGAGETHEISMVYRPNVLVIGCAISAISLCGYLALVILYPALKRTPIIRTLVTVPEKKNKRKANRKKV